MGMGAANQQIRFDERAVWRWPLAASKPMVLLSFSSQRANKFSVEIRRIGENGLRIRP